MLDRPIHLSPSAAARALAVIAVLLLMASVMGQVSRYELDHDHVKGLVPLLDVNGEENVPAYFSWVVPAMALLLVLAAVFFRFLRDLDPTTRRRFLIAGALYVGGAIGMELLGGRYAEDWGQATLTFNLYCSVEEGLEMAGLVFFFWSLLHVGASLGLMVSVGADPRRPVRG